MDLCIWVSIEVKHTMGYLKDTSFADMITMKIPVSDLILMPSKQDMVVYFDQRIYARHKRKRKSHSDSGSADDDGDQSDSSSSSRRYQIWVCKFVYATPQRAAAGTGSRAAEQQQHL